MRQISFAGVDIDEGNIPPSQKEATSALGSLNHAASFTETVSNERYAVLHWTSVAD
jgi:hypothetical protein